MLILITFTLLISFSLAIESPPTKVDNTNNEDDYDTTTTNTQSEEDVTDTSTSSSPSSDPSSPPSDAVYDPVAGDMDWGGNYDPLDEFCGPYDCYKILGFDYADKDTISQSKIKKNYR